MSHEPQRVGPSGRQPRTSLWVKWRGRKRQREVRDGEEDMSSLKIIRSGKIPPNEHREKKAMNSGVK